MQHFQIMSNPNTISTQDSATSPTLDTTGPVVGETSDWIDAETGGDEEANVDDTSFNIKKRKRTSKVWDNFKELERIIDAQAERSSSVSSYGGRKSRREFDSFIKNVDSVTHMNTELDQYFEEGVVIHNGSNEFDVISWWRSNDLKFRILSKLACDIISIPITIVASKSAFSACGRVIDPHRASLGVDTMQMLLCSVDWLRARYGIKRKAKDKTSAKEVNMD